MADPVATMSSLTPEMMEALMLLPPMPTPRWPDPRQHLLDRARAAFSGLFARHPRPPQLGYFRWQSRLESDEIEFETSVFGPRDDWHWRVAAGAFGMQELVAHIRDVFPHSFEHLYREMASAHLVRQLTIEHAERLTSPPWITGVDVGAGDSMTAERVMQARDTMQAMRLPADALVVASNMTATEARARLAQYRRDVVQAYRVADAFGVDPAMLDIAEASPYRQAEERGLKLLKEWLSPAQLDQFEQFGHFEVTGGDSGKRYRIVRGTVQNVYELDREGSDICGWCFAPAGHLVAGDVMLAQKVALETNERGALMVANKFGPGARYGVIQTIPTPGPGWLRHLIEGVWA